MNALPDVQGSIDERALVIDRVGIRGVRHPIRWRTADEALASVGLWTLDVQLPAHQKGTHMSRFVALLEEQAAAPGPLDLPSFRELLLRMVHRLEATEGRIEVSFPHFIRKVAPVSGVSSLMDYQLTVSGCVEPAGTVQISLTIVVPVTSLCPCSKGISDYGAHNQRSHVTVHAVVHNDLSIDDLIRSIEAQASCELWGLLKRSDEKFVTERAYDNPKFVEDLVRDVAQALKAQPEIERFWVEAENFESIHNHSAWARITSAGSIGL
ncbi:MAG: GTP cyclohydrolase I FolE2 [Betaproteobacteria bacterium]|jgi:GTP cyclohydrolase I|nr:GTP cyclohydrolase I FolE2 [Betaproteobacteria bacterium]NBY17342.1 GTP cyclohydrolase I FolE2 [Betaproteobacteria bacterium]